jgi:hypothetical protein
MKITLGDSLKKREGSLYDTWPVLRDGQGTKCLVVEGRRGYAFQVPASMRGKSSNRWPDRVFREDARQDAEEWFKERNET